MAQLTAAEWLKLATASMALLPAAPAYAQVKAEAQIDAVFATRAYTAAPSAKNIVIGDDGIAVDGQSVVAAVEPTPLDRPDLKMSGGGQISATPAATPANVKTYSREEIMLAVQTEAQKVGVDPRFAFAIATIESDFDATIVSGDGAIGVMQLMPETARELGVSDPYDAMQNVRGGVAYLAQLQAEFKTPLLVAAAYHSGPQAVRDAQGIPAGPRMASYTVRLLNEFYQIYQLPNDPLAPLDHVATASDLKPIGKPRRSAPARPTITKPAEGGPWEAGFVMNLN